MPGVTPSRHTGGVDAHSQQPLQVDLFSLSPNGTSPDPEPVVMALHRRYYDLIWQGQKHHEFRRRFLVDTPTRWFVWFNAPVSTLSAVIDLGPAIVAPPEQVAEIAEQTRRGNGASVLEYVRDLEQAFAIPILRVREYQGLSGEELRAELGAWHPPQGYIRLNQHRALKALCDKLLADTPTREMLVEHPAP